MKPWDIFKRGVGCLSLFLTFSLGVVTGFLLFWIDSQGKQLIDQPTARHYAIDRAQDNCQDEDHPRPVDCHHYWIASGTEDAQGWMFEVVSADRRRSVGIIVHRQGNSEIEGPVDLDKPDTWPDGRRPIIPDPHETLILNGLPAG